MKKSLAVALTAALALSVFAALPADAKKKKKKPKPCAAYVAGELGAEAETLVVTDTATEEAPLEHAVTLAESLGDANVVGELPPPVGALPAPFQPSASVINLQVDPKDKEAGLYVLFEFTDREDYDLFLRHPDGSEAASSHGFQPFIEGVDTPFGNPNNTESNHGGESTVNSEKLIGIRTADCGGYTLDTQNWLGMGGDFTLKIWLGEAITDPLAPGASEEG